MKSLSNKFPAIIVVLLMIYPLVVPAQNPANPDTTIGMGTFAGGVVDIEIQPDNKIIVGGGFTAHKTVRLGRIARMNMDGSLDKTFDSGSGFNGDVLALELLPDGKILVGGDFTSFNGNPQNYLARLNADGSIDNSFNIGTGPDFRVYSIVRQPDDKLLLGGFFANFNGQPHNYVVRLNSDGTVDNTFNIGSGADTYVYTTELQSDGKILVGGSFSNFNGVAKSGLIRLNSDGSVDNTFTVQTDANTTINAIVVQADGKVLTGGYFSSYNGITTGALVRLNSDGSHDNTFSSAPTANSYIQDLTLQPDGKILVGGGAARLSRLNSDGSNDNSFSIPGGLNGPALKTIVLTNGKILSAGQFTIFNNEFCNGIVLLNADGSTDPSLKNSGQGFNNTVYAIAVQPDKKLLIGGYYTAFNNSIQNRLVRLNPDGTKDNSFDIGTGFDGLIHVIALQPDKKILIGGAYNNYNGVQKRCLVRLNPDGSIDNSFNVGNATHSAPVYTIAVQPDGKILIGGSFTQYNGVTKNRIVRLNTDGTIDNFFNVGTGANNSVYSIVLQPDGKILVAGDFTFFGGSAKNRIVRLHQNGSIDNSFAIGTGSDNQVTTMLLQPDGKIVAGGMFTQYHTESRSRLMRLNPNGTMDKTFNIGSGVLGSVRALALQDNGKLVVAGDFQSYNGVGQRYIIRVLPNGSLDPSFTGTGPNYIVHAVALEGDERIVAGGEFSFFNEISYNHVVRLQGDRSYLNTIRGRVYTDANADCNFQLTETPVNSVILKAEPGPYYANSDTYGKYELKVDSGAVAYTLTQEFNSIDSILLESQCSELYNVSLTGAANDTCCFNFADTLKQCALLNISIQNTRMRRCFFGATFVSYVNYGYADAPNTQVKIIYPPHVIPMSSTPMWTSKTDSMLIFDLGTLVKNGQGKISIVDSVACIAGIYGTTECIKATISASVPDCAPVNPAWDLSSIAVDGKCKNEQIYFTITNKGGGNMSDSLDFRIFANDTLILTHKYKLTSGEVLPVSYTPEDETVRLEADQSPHHPGKSRPRITIQGCGPTNHASSYVSTAPQDDDDEETAITCNEIIDSYDPNDKQAIPGGTGTEHNIPSNQEIEYAIRFQNTGSDTAYTVRIVDTLDVNVDMRTFTEGTSSHPYTLNVSGKGRPILTFNFYNINLPDSTKNKLGSQGVVSFRVKIPSSISSGTVITNKAYIFFDYNDAIITNETMHTIKNTVEMNLSKGDLVQVGSVTGLKNKFSYKARIYPNPSAGQIALDLPETGSNREMRLFSVVGTLLRTLPLNSSTSQQITLEGLQQGIYVYEIWQEGERKAGGMLQIE